MLRLMPRMFALIAVQRQTAASTSTRPWMRVQHGATGGLPIVMLSNPCNTLAQTPSFRASVGHFPVGLGLGLGFGFGFGCGFGCGLGFGVGQPQPLALENVKKRMFTRRKRAIAEVLLELAIFVLVFLLKN